jgi:hypothetical protein
MRLADKIRRSFLFSKAHPETQLSFAFHKKIVGVSGNPQSNRYRLLFTALAQLYPIEFREIVSVKNETLDGLVVLDGRIPEGKAAAARGIPAYVVVTDVSGATQTAGSEVRFGTSDCLDVALRGQTMTETGTVAVPVLQVETGDEVLATKGGKPVWLSRQAGTAPCQLITVPPPSLAHGELLFQYLGGERFLGLLALVNFLRRIVQDIDWQDAPVQTCFVFDDPSLYWPSYGFVDYRLLAELAANHGLFVSVATIPLDTWWVNSSVAATFRSTSPRLSVIIHGNNHIAHEMLGERGSEDHLQIAAQAIRRIERLERHGLSGFRIMEAPHGAISHDMMGHLMSLGYEAVLCTTELLVYHNPTVAWPPTLGMDRAEFLGGGLPAISRVKMKADWKNEVILSAFLRKPFVIAGHHWDAVDHFRLLKEIAQCIKGLHPLAWASPLDIVRSNYKSIHRHNELRIKMYARTLRVPVPEGVTQLFVHRPWLKSADHTETLQVANSGGQIFRKAGNSIVGPITVKPGEGVEIRSLPNQPIDFRTVRTPRSDGWPFFRKLLMELRDRSGPTRYKASQLIRGAKAKVPGKKEDY